MEIRYAHHPEDFKTYTTEKMRREFLIPSIMVPGEITLVYSHVDRIIAGGAVPIKPLALEAGKELGVSFFLERRELGIINVGPQGTVTLDGEKHVLDKTDGLYVGLGVKEIIFSSTDPENPAHFYINSTPAHKAYPTTKILRKDIQPAALGALAQSNERKIYKYIHPLGVKSCQLVMGMTALATGSMWNTMPTHTHERRMEVYFYFDLPEDSIVFHMMGQPQETRHIVVRNEQAVISPSWSIHSGVGTVNYTFIWGMAGENQTFDDMDAVPMRNLK
ncbi:MAG TPA: 5-dehydro-4-deoxy-D-glucuronate isomerase [Negativicutes bacterium]|nr:5-dehydro-4-deoxy-D-glucuronate isomerase [Negativicutes bacterium]